MKNVRKNTLPIDFSHWSKLILFFSPWTLPMRQYKLCINHLCEYHDCAYDLTTFWMLVIHRNQQINFNLLHLLKQNIENSLKSHRKLPCFYWITSMELFNSNRKQFHQFIARISSKKKSPFRDLWFFLLPFPKDQRPLTLYGWNFVLIVHLCDIFWCFIALLR